MTKLAQDRSAKVAQAVGKKWKVTAEGNIIKVKRDEPVEWNNGISLPDYRRDNLKEGGFFVKERYSIWITLTPPLTPAQVQAMRDRNADVQRQMEDLHSERWRQEGELRPPENPKDKPDYEKYLRLQSQLQRAPDLVTAEASVAFDTYLGDKFRHGPAGLGHLLFRCGTGRLPGNAAVREVRLHVSPGGDERPGAPGGAAGGGERRPAGR